jgi:hypothetical protein
MNTELTTIKDNAPLAPINSHDGWGDAAADAADRMLRGTLLKFADGQWTTGKEGNAVKQGLRLVALATSHAWVKWSSGAPSEYKVRQPGESLPERDELGDTDEAQWEAGPDGKPRDPWQNTRFVYLVDPKTQEAFTFSTSSWGGRGAIIDLADQIQRKRFSSSCIVPEVELHSAPMQTKFGRKSRPVFKVVAWRNSVDDDDEGQPKPGPKLVASNKNADMDDTIPF